MKVFQMPNLSLMDIKEGRDRHKHGSRLNDFFRQGFICKRLKKRNCSECICSEFTMSKRS